MSTELCTQCGMPRSDHQSITQFCPVGHWDFSKTDTFAAPAPEVQGTPKVDPNWPWTAEQVAAESAKGTPQKETPTMPYGADAQNFGAVPEGVQGKEPPQRAPLNSEIELHNAYVSGEAAGRRSAITEMQETVADWGRRSRDASFVEACDWCLKKCAELLEKTK